MKKLSEQIAELLGILGAPSLKAVSMLLGVSSTRIYTVAKTPAQNDEYVQDEHNWHAVAQYCLSKKPTMALGDIILAALAIDAELRRNDKRYKTAEQVVYTTINGENVVLRKYPEHDMAANKVVVLRDDPNLYKIVYQTLLCSVLQPVDADGNFISQQCRMVTNKVLNKNGFHGTGLEEAINRRKARRGE